MLVAELMLVSMTIAVASEFDSMGQSGNACF